MLKIKSIIACLLAIMLSVSIFIFAGCSSQEDNGDSYHSDAETEESASDSDTAAEADNSTSEEAFHEFLQHQFDIADDHAGPGYPVFKPRENVTEVWDSYAIDDFDGDGAPELLVFAVHDYLDSVGNRLIMYEYRDGSVQQGRSTVFVPDDPAQNTEFYPNGVVMEFTGDSYETIRVYFLDDRFLDRFHPDNDDMDERYLLYYRSENDGTIRRMPTYGAIGDEKILTEEEWTKDMDLFTRDEEYASYWKIEPEFKDIIPGEI